MLAVFLTSLLLGPGTQALPPWRPEVQWFAEGSGLPSLAVSDLDQDASGKVWVNTQKGIAHWQAGRFYAIPPAEGGPEVGTQLLCTPRGLVVASMVSGLRRWDGMRWHAVQPPPGAAIGRPSQLVKGPDGKIRVVWGGGLLCDLVGDQLVPAAAPPPGPLNSLTAAPSGWFAATAQGLYREVGSRWEPVPGSPRPIQAVCPSPDGRTLLLCGPDHTWILEGGRLKPLRSLDGQSFHQAVTAPGPSGGPAFYLLSRQSLVCVEGETVHPIPLDPDDPPQLRRLRTTQAQGRTQIWVASLNGIARLQPGGWNTLPPGTGPSHRSIYALRRTSDGRIWIGDVVGRVHTWFQGRWTRSDLPGIQSRSSVSALERLPDGTLLASGPRGTLWVNHGGGWTEERRGSLLTGAMITGLASGVHQGQSGAWVVSEVGLHFWSAARGIQPVTRPSEPIRWILPFPGAEGTFLTGGNGGTVWRWDGQALTPFTTLPGASLQTHACLAVHGGTWHLRVATHGQGLFTVSPQGQVVTRWSQGNPEGWPSDTVLSVAEGPDGRTWAATDNGLALLTPEGRLEQTFTRSDGLPSDLCTNTALVVTPEGTAWVGTARGVAWLATPPPPLRGPEGFRLMEARSEHGTFLPGATLPAGTRRLAFQFEVPVLHREEDLRYRAQVEGLEPTPTPWSASSRIELTGLAPGSYRLKVWCRDGQGREAAPLVIPFTLARPLWRHPASVILLLLAAAAGAVGLHRLRIRRLRTRNRVLSAAVQEATQELREANEDLYRLNNEKNRVIGVAAHDLRSPLTGIQLTCDLLLEDQPEPAATDIRRIRDLCQHMTTLIQSLLDLHAIEHSPTGVPHLERVSPREVLTSIQGTYAPRAQRKDQSLVVEAVCPDPVLVDRHHLLRILDNLASNAVKYSPLGGTIWMRARRVEGFIRFEIQDQGPGLTAEDLQRVFGTYARLSARPTGGEPTVGLGLSIVRQLAEEMGGRAGVDSVQDEGATFWVDLLPAEAP